MPRFGYDEDAGGRRTDRQPRFPGPLQDHSGAGENLGTRPPASRGPPVLAPVSRTDTMRDPAADVNTWPIEAERRDGARRRGG